jgi:phosphoribosylanthranilate isomerase
VIIQIYAFTRIDQAVAAADLGVDHIGFIAGKYCLVPGELSFAEARRLAEALPPSSVRVALTMATSVNEILRMAEAVGPDIVHISTDLEEVGEGAMELLRLRLPTKIRLMKAIQVEGKASIADAQRFALVSDLLLLDTKVRGMPGIGATGRTHDWRISQRIVESVSIPVILAGGLSPENVGAAIAAVQPWGVDSNTWTNLPDSPVEKDLARIRAFVEAVRQPATP